MKKKGFHVKRTINAKMVERFIFNFRMKPEVLERHLPTTLLKPQVVNGWSFMSFCILKLEKLQLGFLPPFSPFNCLSCAYRAGIIDHSKNPPEPSVWITDRNSNHKLIKLLAPAIMRDKVPMIEAAIGHAGEMIHTQFSFKDGQHYFSAQSKIADDPFLMDSVAFKNVDEFAAFIKGGVSSYTPSNRPDALAAVDLYKDDVVYEALDAKIEFSWLHENWKDADIEFDSAVRATGSTYKWVYRGLYLLE